MFWLLYRQKVLSLKTEFNPTNRCLAVSSYPFKSHWCPASTVGPLRAQIWLANKHVSECIIELVMENSHLYKLLFYSIYSK